MDKYTLLFCFSILCLTGLVIRLYEIKKVLEFKNDTYTKYIEKIHSLNNALIVHNLVEKSELIEYDNPDKHNTNSVLNEEYQPEVKSMNYLSYMMDILQKLNEHKR